MKNLKVVIVGGGMGGLESAIALASDGHEVLVLEAAEEFAEAGAGIRVPPNSSRLCARWGLDFSPLKKEVSRGNRFLDWKDGRKLLDVPFHDVEERYGAPYYFIHRADLADALVKTARGKSGVMVETGKRVVEYDFEGPRVRTADGMWYAGDLVIAADGIKSIARDVINGSPAKAVDTGDVAYRILIPVKGLMGDPELEKLVTEPWATTWTGPEGHFVGYPLRGGELYNMIVCCSVKSTSHGQSLGEDDWLVTADNAELVRRFKGWCSPVQKLCGLAGQIPFLKWKMADLRPLNHWVHPSGKVALLGDSCHPMLPYLAQGAAQATEDAGTLRAAIAHYSTVPEALAAYERQRLPRAANITANTRIHQDWLHIYDGPYRDERDRLMQRDAKDNPIFWAYTPRKNWLFEYDAERLLKEDELNIPELPPLPPSDVSVYKSAGQVQSSL